jgi:hypothetical protein
LNFDHFIWPFHGIKMAAGQESGKANQRGASIIIAPLWNNMFCLIILLVDIK